MRKTSILVPITTHEYIKEKINIAEEKRSKLREKLEEIYYSNKLKIEKLELISKTGFSNKGQTITPYYIIKDQSPSKILWDFFVSLVTIFVTLFIPLDLGFAVECFMNKDSQNLYKNINITILIIFLIDMILTFFTALENEKGEYEYELKIIALNYLRTTFFIEFLANLPLEFASEFDTSTCWQDSISTNKLILLIRFLRCNKLFRINKILEKYTPESLISIIRLLKIIMIYYFIIHIIGITFTTLSITLLKKLPDNIKDTSPGSFFTLYSFCLFIGIYLVLGNDFAYTTSKEKMLIIGINVVALITNANIFGLVAVTLKTTSVGGDDDPSNLERLDSINDFLNYEGTSQKLKTDIRNYYILMYRRQRELYFNTNVFDDLSDCLKVNAKYEYWQKNYFSLDTFFVNHSSQFLHDSLIIMKAKMILMNERLIHEGESSTDFYLITDGGRFAVMIHGIHLKILKEGEYFGETAIFLSSEKRTASVDSLNLSDILYIPGKDFVNLLRNHYEEADYLKSVAMSNFYNTVALTRTSLATHLFPLNLKDPLFKSNLYVDKLRPTKKMNESQNRS